MIIDLDGNNQINSSKHSNWMLQHRLDKEGNVIKSLDSKSKEEKDSPVTDGYYPSLHHALLAYVKNSVIKENKDKVISLSEYLTQLEAKYEKVNELLDK